MLCNKNRKKIAGVLLAAEMAAVLFGGQSLDAMALTPDQAVNEEAAEKALQELVTCREIMAVVYLTDSYTVRAEASESGEGVAEVFSGQTVFITGVTLDEYHQPWVQVSFYQGEEEYQGYISGNYLVSSDERLRAWEEQYGILFGADSAYSVDMAAEGQSTYADIAQFPESYQSALTVLKQQHPTWVFVPMSTGLDWNTVITNEMKGGRSLVYKSFPDHVKLEAYDGGSWYYASREILEMYMDPRNSLTEDAIFQFEQLTYNASYHTEAALERFLQNTFMNSSQNAPGTVMTYAHIIWAIGAESSRKVSPFHLAARIYQEQGSGGSALISGTYPGYEGYYNYFNIGASGKTTTDVIVNGLTYAKNATPPWNSAYYSILGGADIISANYIRKGQDTLYLQKYNVNPSATHPLYTHQYMQNISAPTSEAKTIRNLYKNAGALESTFVFKIPVYYNMPSEACPMPEPSPCVDVDRNGWQYPYVKYALDNGLMGGKGTNADGLIIFEPNEGMTRDQFVQMLYSREGKPEVSYSERFTDVPDGKWYTDAIMWAAENGLAAGKDGAFGVDDMITREEMATMLRQYAAFKGCDTATTTDITGYADAFLVSEWAYENMQWAISKGIIAGQGNKLAPQSKATRAEGATMMKGFIENCK